MQAAVRTRGLTRRFGDRIAVNDVSLSVPARSVYGFLGRNGAGKTTTIKLLLGLLRPDAGSAWIDGIDIARDRLNAARRIGALLDAHGFYAHLTGRENLDLSRRLLSLPRNEIDRVLEVTGMSTHGRRRVADYSLGMRQRLGLARALLGAPAVLILDEPTNGLDPEGIAEMRQFLRTLPERSRATVLLSSHLLGEIEQTATHVGILSEGRLVLEGELENLKAGLAAEVWVETDQNARAADIARASGFAVELRASALVARVSPGESSGFAAAELNRLLVQSDIAVHRLAPQRPSLETLYRTVAHAEVADA